MPTFHERARQALPRLTVDNYRVSSPATWEYNCIAWAAGATDAWWWPVPGRYWPHGAPREETTAAIILAFARCRLGSELLPSAPYLCYNADVSSRSGRIDHGRHD